MERDRNIEEARKVKTTSKTSTVFFSFSSKHMHCSELPSFWATEFSGQRRNCISGCSSLVWYPKEFLVEGAMVLMYILVFVILFPALGNSGSKYSANRKGVAGKSFKPRGNELKSKEQILKARHRKQQTTQRQNRGTQKGKGVKGKPGKKKWRRGISDVSGAFSWNLRKPSKELPLNILQS